MELIKAFFIPAIIIATLVGWNGKFKHVVMFAIIWVSFCVACILFT